MSAMQAGTRSYVQELEQLPLGYTTSTNILSTVNNVIGGDSALQRLQLHHFTRLGASSVYNGLQVKVSRRFSNTLTINADYTWSKAIDLDDQDNEAERHSRLHPAQAVLRSCRFRSSKRLQLPIRL